MLTLTRKEGQKILIGDGIEILVREIRGRQVRFGITAPRGLPVYREELYLQIADVNTRSTNEVSADRMSALDPPVPGADAATPTPKRRKVP